METYTPGEIVLLLFPFVNTISVKRRPAIILVDTGDEDIIVARITTQNNQTKFDVPIKDWNMIGLLLPSYVRIHKIATIEKNLVEKRLGKTTDDDWKQIKDIIHFLWK